MLTLNHEDMLPYRALHHNVNINWTKKPTTRKEDSSEGKREFIDRLINEEFDQIYLYQGENSDLDHFITQLVKLPIEKLKPLSEILGSFFTNKCNNTHRQQIVDAFLSVSQEGWVALKERIKFIMPDSDCDGVHLVSVAQILATHFDKENTLVNTANLFVELSTANVERVYILKGLTSQDLAKAKKWDDEKREEFRNKAIPQIVSEGLKV